LTSLVAAAWRLSYEVVTNWLARCDDAARYERPELATSRLKVLAFVNT
jgi:hypothetical protein